MPPRSFAYLLALALAAVTPLGLRAQYTGYSLKLGPTLAFQNWEGYNQSPLFAFHADLQVESLSDTDPNSLYASLGYHQRGSSIRTQTFTIGGQRFRQEPIDFIFHNVALALGAKRGATVLGQRGHVAFALRGEVNVGSDLGGDIAEDRNMRSPTGVRFPLDEFVNRFVAGVDVGAGIDFSISPSAECMVEFRVSPDFTRQYRQPPLNVTVRDNTGAPIGTAVQPEESISNVTIELSIGFRLVRYPYVEED